MLPARPEWYELSSNCRGYALTDELLASITASATPNGLIHQRERPKCPRHKGFEKSGRALEVPKVANAVIRADMPRRNPQGLMRSMRIFVAGASGAIGTLVDGERQKQG